MVIFLEELKDYLLGENAMNKIFTLGNSEFPVSWENEIKLWTFLETRTALLLKTYKTTIEVSWQQCDFSFHVDGLVESKRVFMVLFSSLLFW